MATPVLKAKLVGAETIVGDLNRYSQTIRAQLAAVVEQSSVELAARARSLAPKKSRALAASIGWAGQNTDKKITGTVGTDLFYGRFQESGWTPNASHSFAGVGDILGPHGPSTVSMKKAGWVRNPRKASQWAAKLGPGGKRKIFAHPFLKPALASMRGTINQRLIAAVRGRS